MITITEDQKHFTITGTVEAVSEPIKHPGNGWCLTYTIDGEQINVPQAYSFIWDDEAEKAVLVNVGEVVETQGVIDRRGARFARGAAGTPAQAFRRIG